MIIDEYIDIELTMPQVLTVGHYYCTEGKDLPVKDHLRHCKKVYQGMLREWPSTRPADVKRWLGQMEGTVYLRLLPEEIAVVKAILGAPAPSPGILPRMEPQTPPVREKEPQSQLKLF